MIFQDHPLGAALAAALWGDAKPLPTVGLRPLSCTPGEEGFGRTFLAAKKTVRPSSVNEISDAMRERTFSPLFGVKTVLFDGVAVLVALVAHFAGMTLTLEGQNK
jgi:hypothetical protein